MAAQLDQLTIVGDPDVRRDLSAIVDALTHAVQAKDDATGTHLYRSTMMANACLELLDASLADDEAVSHGFLLHDVGKIGVPDVVLNKPGALDAAEWEIMRSHPEMGLRIVAPIGFAPATLEVIAFHHERWDGAGYPYRLAGEQIPLTARVFAVADAYDALTSERPYRMSLTKIEALRLIHAEAGRGFDPRVVAAFNAILS